MGTLFLVATPIGNLEDMSARAIRVLGEVSLIAAEDTRHTRKLLTHFNLRTPLTSYYEFNKLSKLDEVLGVLEKGNVALVSDAGTPALNDPGYELVRAALAAGHEVSPVPGASAPLAALVSSGLATDAFLYLGYLPRKSSERQRLLESVKNAPYTLIFLEAPHRLLDTLDDLLSVLGNRQIAVARELTKLHEEIFRGKTSEAQHHYKKNEPRGEITLVITGYQPEAVQRRSREEVNELIGEALANGDRPAQIAGRLAKETGWGRRELYDLISQATHKPRS